ncbi:MAG: hypothetical protein V3U86_13960 [Acidobacteriota bacterium]|nr:hypothetical protein [Acidobacteriota bacterium]
MAHFIGGSAYTMAKDIAEGLILLNGTMLRRFSRADVQQVLFELDKIVRESRSIIVEQADIQAIQKKNRRLSRIMSALQILKSKLSARR